MTYAKKIILKVVTLFLIFGFNNAFSADDIKSKEIASFVDEVGNKIVSIAGEKKYNDKIRKEKIIAVIDKVIDSNWIARFVLGRHFKTISDEQKHRFANTYRDFMINTYGPKFNSYHGKKFSVKSVERQGMLYAAKAEFLPIDSNQPISIDFRVKDSNGKLSIVDFIAEGISLIETQRSEFSSAIEEFGIDEFLKKLEQRIKDLKAQK